MVQGLRRLEGPRVYLGVSSMHRAEAIHLPIRGGVVGFGIGVDTLLISGVIAMRLPSHLEGRAMMIIWGRWKECLHYEKQWAKTESTIERNNRQFRIVEIKNIIEGASFIS